MEYIVLILLTYPASLLFEADRIRKIVKDATSNGYIINPKYFRESKENSDKRNIINKYYLYIPFVNMFTSLTKDLEYTFDRPNQFELFRVTGAFFKMTKEEEEYFNEKPTMLRAFNLSSIRDKEYNKLEEKYNNRNVNYDDNLKEEIVKLDKELDTHDIIKLDNDEEKLVSINELINNMSTNELEELKSSLIAFKDYRKLFDDDLEGEYIIDSKKDKCLTLSFKNKNRGE